MRWAVMPAPCRIFKAQSMPSANLVLRFLLVGPEARIRQELAKFSTVPPVLTFAMQLRKYVWVNIPRTPYAKKKIQHRRRGPAGEKRECRRLCLDGAYGRNLAAAVLHLQRIKGVHRPALGALFPTPKGPGFLIDVGANTDCKAEWLEQFALMGEIYMRAGLRNPPAARGPVGERRRRNQGESSGAGAHVLLKQRALESGMNFVGNLEGKDVPTSPM